MSSAQVLHCLIRPVRIMFVPAVAIIITAFALFVIGIQQTSSIIQRTPRRPCVEHSKLLHLPFAKGRIENGLSPAPLRQKRFIGIRFVEAWSVLLGRSIGVRCHYNMEERDDEEPFVDGTVGKHPLVRRQAG